VSRREWILAGTAGAVFAVAFSAPIYPRLGRIGHHADWDLLWSLQWAAYDSVVRFHQLPLWNPYRCGGMPLFAHPHSRIATPFFLLHLLLGPFLAVYLEIPLHLAIAWAGGYYLARVQALRPLAAIAVASVFPASSWLYLHLGIGHVIYLGSLYLPWILALLWRSMRGRSLFPAALGGLLVALTLGEGGVYPVPQALLLATLLACSLALLERTPRPLVALVTLFAFSAGFAAVKLAPSYLLLRSQPRPVKLEEVYSLRDLASGLFSRLQDCRRGGGGIWGFHELGAYIGIPVTLLAVIGVLAAPRRTAPWLVSGTALVALALGDTFGPASPWRLLHRLPPFSSERVSLRFLIPFPLTVGVLAGFGLEALTTSFRRAGAVCCALLLAVALVDFWLVGPHNLKYVFARPLVAWPAAHSFEQHTGAAGFDRSLALAMANVGAVTCYDYKPMQSAVRGANAAGYRGEQHLRGPGSVTLADWSPNRLAYDVDAPGATVLVVNQNYDPGWHLIAGEGEVVSDGGLLAVRVPHGRQRLRLAYRGRGLFVGATTTIATILAALILWRRESP
jgi:hypothetical protein